MHVNYRTKFVHLVRIRTDCNSCTEVTISERSLVKNECSQNGKFTRIFTKLQCAYVGMIDKVKAIHKTKERENRERRKEGLFVHAWRGGMLL
jgi:hypothetical protein